MLFLAATVIFGTACGVVLFLLLISGDFEKFRQRFDDALTHHSKYQRFLPTMTELDLDLLRRHLEKKQSDMEASKDRVVVAVESLQRLADTSNDMRRYYVKLKEDVVRSQEDCRHLQAQIEQYRKKRALHIEEEDGLGACLSSTTLVGVS